MRTYEEVTAERHAARMTGDRKAFNTLDAEWHEVKRVEDQSIRFKDPTAATKQANERMFAEIAQAKEADLAKVERRAEAKIATAKEKAEVDERREYRVIVRVEREQAATERQALRLAAAPEKTMIALTKIAQQLDKLGYKDLATAVRAARPA